MKKLLNKKSIFLVGFLIVMIANVFEPVSWIEVGMFIMILAIGVDE